MLLPQDCINNIISYIGCVKKNKYFKTCKNLNKIYCIPLNYKNLYCCSIHDNNDSDIKHIINVLKNETENLKNETKILKNKTENLKTMPDIFKNEKGKNITSIHFKSVQCMDTAMPYINELGKISHFCCNGKGVMIFPYEQ